MIIQKTNIS
jgi:hypothetical protein